ncbi:MAG TPA: hypothetical protein VFU79_04225 [Nitrososphaeraceae archaeon]|nr:hypothetical protein [Nitrososphaeraceae archaeon]
MRTIEFTGTISDPTMESFNLSALSTGYLTSVSDATANGPAESGGTCFDNHP